MKDQNPPPRFFLRSLVAAVLMDAVITPITAVAVPDNLYVSANQGRSIFEYTPAGTQSTFAVVNPQLPRGCRSQPNYLRIHAGRHPDHFHRPGSLRPRKSRGAISL